MLCKMIKIVGGNYHGRIANCPSVAELEEKRSKIVPYLHSTVQYSHHIHQRWERAVTSLPFHDA